MPRQTAVPEVLIVEDGGADAHQALKVLTDLGIKKVKLLTGDEQAVEYLRTIEDRDGEAPRFILLDLLLGMGSGFEILRYCKSSVRFKNVPVIVWTQVTGKTEQEICSRFGITAFVQKQDGAPALDSTLRTIISHDSWA